MGIAIRRKYWCSDTSPHLEFFIVKESSVQDLDEVLLRFAHAYKDLAAIIAEKANGDWSKLSLLIESIDEVRNLTDSLLNAADEFRQATPMGVFISYSQELQNLAQAIEMLGAPTDNKERFSIESSLETARDMLEDVLEAGSEDDRVRALNQLLQFPNFSPDDWDRRRYMLSAVYLARRPLTIPSYVTSRFNEACNSFIYGNFLATIALARSVLELVLKERFPLFKSLTLEEITRKQWDRINGLKGQNEIREKADLIRQSGNQILHKAKDKISHIFNEWAASKVLRDLKTVLEFLYSLEKI
jgi:hypothetical protein